MLARALANLHTVDPARGLWPWLVAMANNRIVDLHRQQVTTSAGSDDVRVIETLVPSTRMRLADPTTFLTDDNCGLLPVDACTPLIETWDDVAPAFPVSLEN